MDRAKFGTCLSPSGHDSLEPHDLPFGKQLKYVAFFLSFSVVIYLPMVFFYLGPRMFYNSREAMLRRKLEQEAELQQAIELQERRLMNLQLVDQKNHQNYHHFQPSSFPSIPVPSVSNPLSQNNQDVIADNDVKLPWEASEVHETDSGNETSKEQSADHDDPELNKRY